MFHAVSLYGYYNLIKITPYPDEM